MKKIELLSPAGDFETLKMVVKCGADAVYISGKDYGARKYAENFTLEEIEAGVKYCHLYGVKLYVTVNTLIDEDKILDVTNYVRKLHKMGVDALIMQDIGMISYLKKKFPNLEVHASTQTHNCNNDSVSYLETLGVSRVVLARELSLEEIEKLKTPLELEVFIHGALCVSYSGQCLMSARLFNRSGNKGACAQPCRFCYNLFKEDEKVFFDGDYLLSMRELCVLEKISKLIELGVSSLKIEGRMKSKYYSGYVTKIYRKLIDCYYNKLELNISEKEYNNLFKLYNRKFTTGFLNSDKNVVNPRTCNHQGFIFGKVVSFGKRIKIELFDDITQGDGIRFSDGSGMICNYIYNNKDLLVNGAKRGEVIYLDNKVNLKEKGYVYKTLDVSLNKEIDSFEDKKIPLKFEVCAKIGEEFSVSVLCDEIRINKKMGRVERALNVPTTKKEILLKLSRLGDTPFYLEDVCFDMDEDVFVPIKNVNVLRRELVKELISIRENKKIDFIENDISFEKNKMKITNEISFLVRNEEQLKFLLDKNVNIYVENYKLYKKYESDNVFYRNPRAGFNYRDASNSLISNNGGFIKVSGKSVSDIYMNAFNSLTVNAFSNYVYKVGLSPELSNYDVGVVLDVYKEKYGFLPNVEVLIYGRLEVMLMKYCPVNYLCSKVKGCSLCFDNKYYLDDCRGNKFRLLGDENHNTRIFDFSVVDKFSDIGYLKSIGVTNFRIDLLDESIKEISKLLEKCFSI